MLMNVNEILSVRQVDIRASCWWIFLFSLHNRLMVSSTNNSSNFTREETDLAVRDPRGKADDLPVDRDATESSHQWTDEVEYSRSPKC